MYDDLYAFLPTQGWMFLPITDCTQQLLLSVSVTA